MSRKTQNTGATQKHDNGTQFYSAEKILASVKNVKETNTYSIDEFSLAPYITLDIVYMSDCNFASINIHGVTIRGKIVEGKNGAFISLPSYKDKSGNYKELVTIFNKDMLEAIKIVLNEVG